MATTEDMIIIRETAQLASSYYPENLRPFVTELLVTGGLTASINAGRIDFTNWAYPSYQHLVLGEGSVREGSFPLTSDEVGVMPIKECFTNAYEVAVTHPKRYWYTEGYANYGLIAVNHAWLTEKRTGRIIDPTWAGIDHKEDDAPLYAGIRFSTEFLLKRTTQTGHFSILSEDWRVDTAALRFGFTMRNGIATNGRIK